MTGDEEEESTWTVTEVYKDYAIARGHVGTFQLSVIAPLPLKMGLATTYGNVRDCKRYIDNRIKAIN